MFSAKQRLDIASNFIRRRGRRESLYHSSLPIDKKLREVPFNCLGAQYPSLFAFKKPVQRVCMRPIDVNLRKQRKRDVVFGRAEVLDLGPTPCYCGPESVPGD